MQEKCPRRRLRSPDVERVEGPQLVTQLGTARDAMEQAVDICREMTTVTSSERKRLNEAMDDLTIEVERVKAAYTRLYERAGQQQLGGR